LSESSGGTSKKQADIVEKTSTKPAKDATMDPYGPAHASINLNQDVSKTMTLVPYDPDRLDALSLRMLDLCARLRKLAQTSRDERLPAVDLHDRKALEWLEKLEAWAIGAEAELHRCVQLAKGARAAEPFVATSRRK
jgi:hypothetical protein